METTINKSDVFKRAWKIFRGHSEFSYSFSSSLKRAWWVEKENATPKVEKEECKVEIFQVIAEATKPQVSSCVITQEAYDNFYRGCRYFGD